MLINGHSEQRPVYIASALYEAELDDNDNLEWVDFRSVEAGCCLGMAVYSHPIRGRIGLSAYGSYDSFPGPDTFRGFAPTMAKRNSPVLASRSITISQ